MAALDQLLIDLPRRLGTGDTSYFTTALQKEALNLARREILMDYEVTDFIRETTISFTSGVGTIPSDYMRAVNPESNKKRDLWNDSTDEDYTQVTWQRFDNEESLIWSIEKTTGTRRMRIFEADTVTLNIRYVLDPTPMSADTDDSGFNVMFDKAHTLLAAHILLFQKREYDNALAVRNEYEREMFRVMARQSQEDGETYQGSIERAVYRANLDTDNDFIL